MQFKLQTLKDPAAYSIFLDCSKTQYNLYAGSNGVGLGLKDPIPESLCTGERHVHLI